MRYVYLQKNNGSYGSVFFCLAIGFSLLFTSVLLPYCAFAQGMGSVITYHDSIYNDEEESRLINPSFVTTDPVTNDIYIIDGKGRIIIYTDDFFPLYTIRKNQYLKAPQGITIDTEGKLYVTQSATPESPSIVSVFSSCLRWERNIEVKGFEGDDSFEPHRVAIDGKGNLYVAANHFPGVIVMDDKGHFLDVISPEEEGKKVSLNNVALDQAGRIYVLSESEGRIYIYDENRKFLFKFGEKGGGSGKLSRPKAISIDKKSGRIYVVDYMRHTVTVYDQEGTYIFEFGGLGWGEGWFQYPVDLHVDRDGRILVADLFNQRVQVFIAW